MEDSDQQELDSEVHDDAADRLEVLNPHATTATLNLQNFDASLAKDVIVNDHSEGTFESEHVVYFVCFSIYHMVSIN